MSYERNSKCFFARERGARALARARQRTFSELEHSGRVNMFESGGFVQTRSTDGPDQNSTSSFVNIRRWGTYEA